ncbi:MAG: 2-(3-amino-3-carboxypropyl)histidine synthase subunit [Nanoarchaeota archaeon]|nr:2-(3-amino-3-carboxypropyl)histidine synthase subunit [Nanoarchaeota archaeon]
MKVFFAEVSYENKVKLPRKLIGKLPKNIALFTTAQYLSQLYSWKKQLEKAKKHVILLETKHTETPGQILGCNTEEFIADFDAFLFVGDGVFHPQALILKNNKEVFTYNPSTKIDSKLTKEDVETIRKKVIGAKTKFLSSTEIGVIVTTKPGQTKLEKALELKKRFPDKNFYFLIANNINPSEFENFPFIEMFVNTACERIAYDDQSKFRKPVLNLEDID